jgi:hypothetical protein
MQRDRWHYSCHRNSGPCYRTSMLISSDGIAHPLEIGHVGDCVAFGARDALHHGQACQDARTGCGRGQDGDQGPPPACSGTLAASRWLTPDTIREPGKPTWGIATSGTRSAMPNWRRPGSRASGNPDAALAVTVVLLGGRHLLERGPVQERLVHPDGAFIPALAVVDQTPPPRAVASRLACLTRDGLHGGPCRLALCRHIGCLRAACLLMRRPLGDSSIR